MKALEDQAAAQYRDRAAERRMLHGTTDRVPVVTPQQLKRISRQRRGREKAEALAKERERVGRTGDALAPAELDDSNKGSQLLKAMGWKGKGSGLGKDESGITAPIDAVGGMKGSVNKSRTGLGAAGPGGVVILPGDTYRTAARKMVRTAPLQVVGLCAVLDHLLLECLFLCLCVCVSLYSRDHTGSQPIRPAGRARRQRRPTNSTMKRQGVWGHIALITLEMFLYSSRASSGLPTLIK